MDKFIHNIYLVFFTTDQEKNQQYVLSLNPGQIELPYMTLDSNTKVDVHGSMGAYIRENILFLQDDELFMQVISLNDETLSENPEEISSVYGFIVGNNTHVDMQKYTWIPFDFTEENNRYIPLFAEIVRSLT